MAAKSMNDLIGRAILDVDFRARLLADPEAVATAEGYELTPEAAAQIRSMDGDAAEAAARDFSGGAERHAAG